MTEISGVLGGGRCGEIKEEIRNFLKIINMSIFLIVVMISWVIHIKHQIIYLKCTL
jgi:hypothetical protein